MNRKNSHAVVVRFVEVDEQQGLVEGIDRLVREAAAGEKKAVGAIAVAFGPTLISCARRELGWTYEDDAADIVQDFYLALLDQRMRMPKIHGCAVVWMRKMVAHLAREHVRDRGGGWGGGGGGGRSAA